MQYDCGLINGKLGHRDAQREDGVKHRGRTAICKPRTDLSSQSSEGSHAGSTLISDFGPPELSKSNVCSLCYGGPRKAALWGERAGAGPGTCLLPAPGLSLSSSVAWDSGAAPGWASGGWHMAGARQGRCVLGWGVPSRGRSWENTAVNSPLEAQAAHRGAQLPSA